MTGTFLILLACLFWGSDTLIRYPLVERGINPITIVFYEHAVLALLFSSPLIVAIRRLGELKLSDVFSFLVVGALGSAIATVAFTQSFHYLNPSLVILLQKLQPLTAFVLSAIVLKEPIEGKFLLWAGICLTGGFLVSSPDIARFSNLIMSDYERVISDEALRGYALVGVSIVGWGATTVYGKKLSLVGYDTRSIMGGRFLVGLLSLVPFVSWDRSLLLPEGEDYLRVFIMVLISGALAMWLYYQGMKRLTARTTAIAEMFFPFFAIVVNWVFLGKQLNDLQLLGGAILLVGSLIIQVKKY